MKFIVLLGLIGIAVASFSPLGNQVNSWEDGQTYTFEYNGRLLTGLPQLASQFSGVAMKAKIHVSVLSGSRYSLSARNVQFVRVNNELRQPGKGREASAPIEGSGASIAGNWRNVELPEFTSIPSDAARHLEQSTLFEFEESTGEFRSITVSRNDPEWIINFKKALVALFQTKIQASRSAVESNKIESGESDSPYWTVTEQSLDGECQVMYQKNEIPSYMVRDLHSLLSEESVKLCTSSSGRFFEIVKTKDVNSCTKRASYSSYKPGTFECAESANCEGMWSRSSSTRYITCEVNGQQMIQTIVNDGELFQDLFGFNSEKFLTGTHQVMKLIKKDSHSASGSEPSSPITLRSLLYTYKLGEEIVSQGENGSQEKLMEQLNQGSQAWAKIAKTLPRNMRLTATQPQTSEDTDSLIEKISSIFANFVAKDLFNHESIAEKQITMKALNLAHSLSLLNEEQIQTVWDKTISNLKHASYSNGVNYETARQTINYVFFDALMISGSQPAIMYTAKKITENKLSPLQMTSVFMALPSNVITPSRSLLNELFEVIKSSAVAEHSSVWNHAILGYTTLIQRACVSDNRRSSYPTSVYGEFCNEDSEIVIGKLIPFLQEQLEKYAEENPSKRNVVLTALGQLSHANVLPILLPYVDGSASGSSQVARFLSVYSLASVGRRSPNQVVPILFAIYNNRAESTEIRVTAFNTLIKLNPSMTILQKIADSTWSESDSEILKIVNTAFFTMSSQHKQDPMLSSSSSIYEKAYLVYPLVKKTSGMFPTSATIVSADNLPELKVGYNAITSWTASNTTAGVPQNIFYKIRYALDRFNFSPVEFGARFQGLESIADEIIELVAEKKYGGESLAEKVKEQMNSEWKQVVEQLRIKSRKSNSPTEALLWLNIFENAPVLSTFEMTTQNIRREVTRYMENPELLKEKLEGDKIFNIQKFINMAPTEFMIPSDMGFPIVMEVHMPVVMSVKGSINSELSAFSPRASANFQTVFATQYVGYVGTVSPFTKEFVVTGVDQHSVINVPMNLELSANLAEQKFSVKLSSSNSQAEGEVDLLHYHVRPYTVYQPRLIVEPMTLAENFKVINSRTVTKNMEKSFGDYLGLSLRSVVKTQSRFTDLHSIIQRASWFKYSPWNMARFSLVSMAMNEQEQPSLRMHEFKLRFNPSSSSTKDITFTIRAGVATKQPETEPKYHTIKPIESERSPLPFEVKSEKLGEMSRHTERQQKIEKVIRESGIESGVAYSIVSSLTLQGSRTRTFSYTLNAAHGFNLSGLKAKWAVHLENNSSSKKICINGNVQMPSIPTFSIEQLRSALINYEYENVIGFGSSCSESKIVVNGHSKVSEKQKEFSKISPEAKELRRLVEKNAPIAELSQVADKVRRQASSLDEVNFSVKYENVPRWVINVNNRLVQVVKSAWWPYLVVSGSPNQESTNMRENVRIQINSQQKTFDVTISREGSDNVVFKNIRIPYPLNYLVPFSANRNPAGKAVEELTGANLYPVCKLEKDYLQTFDNKTIHAKLDECFHLLAADCSQYKSFSVLARSLSESASSNKEIMINYGKNKIQLTPTSSSSSYSGASIKVKVNGEHIRIGRGEAKPIRDQESRQIIGSIYEAKDGVISAEIKNTVTVTLGGDKLKVEVSPIYKSKLCGLCGNSNGQKKADITGPTMCAYSKPELILASYRVSLPSKPCKQPLAQHIERQLREETEECAKYQEISTKVIKSFEAQTGKCTRHEHEIIEKANKLCFSRLPVTACGPACKPESGRLAEKRVSFTCMEKSRVSQLYAQKIRDGKVLRELENQPESFAISQKLPRSCEPVARGFGGF